jgi:cyclophilin family peptidyl-prolyl cis-trans isomerase
MAEWFKAAVLKTVGSETGPGVRIPLSPPSFAHGEAIRVTAIAVVIATALVAAQGNVEKLKDPSQLTERAPESFRARFDTSQGPFVIVVEREWAPLAADRFYNLVKNGFYNGSRFFRVLDGFMAQFGLHADPDVQSAWRTANLKDEPVMKSNTRGFVSFTRESSPNSRYTMIFINYKDNSYLDADGFAPFGQVVSGMDVVDKLYGGYGRQNIPDQRRILREGNAYLQAEYPKLDYVKTATIEPSAAPAKPN